MIPQPPPGQGPVDPRGAFVPPPPPGAPGFHGQGPGMPGYPPGPGYAMMPPPPMFYPPPKPRGRAKTVFLVLALLLLAVSVLVNLALVGGGAGSEGVAQSTLQEGDARGRIAVVPLNGLIEDAAAQKLDRFLTHSEKDETVKAVVIEIDSPGGTVTASDVIYDRITRFKKKRGVPVVVSMGALATSGGYYAACAADHVFAQKTTITGNIGVLMPRYNFSKLMEKYGVEETTIVSEGAPFKNAGSSFQPVEPGETEYLKGLMDNAFTRFKQVVAEGRSGKLAGNLEDIANGKAYSAEDAKSLGLVDDIGYLHDACAYAAQKAGLTNPTVFKYQDPPSVLDLLLARSTAAGGSAGGSGVTVNGVNVNLDAGLLQQLTTPRPLYLWRGQ